MERTKRLDIFDIAILVLLVVMIVGSPLAMGSVSPWAKNTLFVMSLMIGLLWILQGVKNGKLVVVRDPVIVFIGLFLLVVCLQLVPLGPGLLEKLSPAASEVYSMTLSDYPESGEARTISLTPYHTIGGLKHVATLLLVFIVIASSFRTRAQVLTLIFAMISVGVFEAIYGFADYMSGGKTLFWNERVFGGNRVSGTFVNKNHFAGLLEMIVPMAVGLCMAYVPGRLQGGTFKARAVEAVSSTGIHKQILLALMVIVMTVAIFFSLSRGGMSAAVGAWIPFFLFMGLASGIRRYTLTGLLLILAILCVFFSADSGFVVERIEESVTGESLSWDARVDIWRSCTELIEDYPILGAGLGTFREAFERYQSSLFGDRCAAFAHNDWLQIICETGFAGGLLAISGMLILFVSLARRTIRRRDTFCRWIATGALAGCLAMLIHSLFDFNLYKITSNGIIFAAVIGVWHAVTGMPGGSARSKSGFRAVTISLGRMPLRAFLSVVAIATVVVLAIPSIKAAGADIYFNRYLALTGIEVEQPRLYFFLPTGTDRKIMPSRTEVRAFLDRARSLDDGNPHYIYFAGIEKIQEAEEILRNEAWSGLGDILGGGTDVDREEEERLLVVRALMNTLREDPDLRERRTPILVSAVAMISKAIDLSPATSLFHLNMSGVYSDLGSPDDLIAARRYSETALWLTPDKPSVLFKAGSMDFLDARDEEVGGGGAERRDTAIEAFRRCIESEPSYARDVYRMIMDVGEQTKILFVVTPNRVETYEELARFLEERGEWNEVLRSLDGIRKLLQETGDVPDLDEEELLMKKLELFRKRADVQGRLGRFEERTKEIQIYRELLHESLTADLMDARRLREEAHMNDAYDIIRELTEKNWDDPETLLLAAELCGMPGVAGETSGHENDSNYLFRIAVLDPPLSPKQCKQALAIQEKGEMVNDEDETLRRLVTGCLLCRAGDFGVARNILDSVILDSNLKRSEAVAWYFLGLACEGGGEIPDACEAYRRALEVLPAHSPSQERLLSLDPNKIGERSRIPRTNVTVVFGGKVLLDGYTFLRDDKGEGQRVEGLMLFWRLIDPNVRAYTISVEVLNSALGVDSQNLHGCWGEDIQQKISLPNEIPNPMMLRITLRLGRSQILLTDNGENYIVIKVDL